MRVIESTIPTPGEPKASDLRPSYSVSPPTRYYSLDFWRGLACLMVVAFHSEMYFAASASVPFRWRIANAAFERMWIGVPMFFVISGYCISATADTERRGQAGLSDYFKRRFRRIFPPYWAALGLALLIYATFPALLSSAKPGISGFVPPTMLSFLDWIGNATLTQTWLSTFSRKVYSSWDAKSTWVLLGPAWTLCYEEQFYALTGLLLLIPKWFFFGAAGITAITIFSNHWSLGPTGLFLDGKWLEFAAGMGVYYALNHGPSRSRAVIGLLLAAAALWWSRDFAELLSPAPNEIRQSYVIAYAFACMLIVAKRWDIPFSRSSLAGPVASCGIRCYSIYLVHWPVVKLLMSWADAYGLTGPRITFFGVIPICIASSLGVGWIFYAFVERRFLNSMRPTRPAHQVA
jgi:peptidoglycan/LPS O-acetylase OafA/YrhL